jgi:DNA-directed RNA polymerase specialized sigma24 family protein
MSVMEAEEAKRAAAIERIYRARYGTFLRIAVAILRDEHLAEEVVHDAFVRALRHQSGFGCGSLEGWLWDCRQRGTPEARCGGAEDATGLGGNAYEC